MDLMQTTSQQRQNILKFYNKNDELVKNDINILKQWIYKQEIQLKDDDSFIELILLKNKFNIEKAKKKLETYHRTIKANPEIFRKLGQFKPSDQIAMALCFPKLTENLERVGLMKIIDPDIKKFDFFNGMIIAYTLAYLLIHRDYSLAGRIIVDFDGCTFQHFLKLNPILAFKFMQIYENVFSSKVTGIEIINAPPFISAVLNLAKMVIKPKLLSRITVHENLESLYKNLPKDNLPSDYGGHLLSVKDYIKIYDKALLKEQDLFKELQTLLQIQETKNNLDFGVVGSFKQLNID